MNEQPTQEVPLSRADSSPMPWRLHMPGNLPCYGILKCLIHKQLRQPFLFEENSTQMPFAYAATPTTGTDFGKGALDGALRRIEIFCSLFDIKSMNYTRVTPSTL